MRKFILINPIVAFVVSVFMVSCESEAERPVQKSAEQCIELKKVDLATVNSVAEKVGGIVEQYYQSMSSARSGDLEAANDLFMAAEDEIAASCAELVEIGQELQVSILEVVTENPTEFELSSEDIETLTNMTDEQLAMLAVEISVLPEFEELLTVDGMQISSNLYVQCIADAIGLGEIIEVVDVVRNLMTGGGVGTIVSGTKMVLNATTLSKLVGGLAVRYLGWASVGIAMYKYVRCVKAG